MARQLSHKRALRWLVPWLMIAAISCSSSSDSGLTSGGPEGDSCTAGSECVSGVCSNNRCVGNGTGAPAGSACNGADECASGSCVKGKCSAGADLPDGASCTEADECGSGTCTDGVCGRGSSSGSGSGTTTTVGPQYPGSGNGFRPLTPGCGPDTANQCTGECEQGGGDPSVTVIRPPATLCFAGMEDPTPADPIAVIEQVVETIDGKAYVHLRITFDPAFVDNTYGTGLCCGWEKHTFRDLVGSDHVQLLLTDGDGNTVMDVSLDYISQSATTACGYSSLGVSGGEGKVESGDEAAVVAVTTSLNRNLNGCEYCETLDSPTTDENYTPNADTENWDYRVVYEAWILLSAFGDAGFGQAYITEVHASPSKLDTNTVEVESTPCPPEWDTPYCPPDVSREGGNCFGSPPGGEGGAGSGDDCLPNYQLYLSTEGASMCTPIPFANYPGMAPCPEGYALDLASEGKYCLPE